MTRRELDAWLLAEDGGDEEAADAAFSQVFSAVPKVEPSPMFVEQALNASWAWRARRRRRLALSWSAAAVLAVVAAASLVLASAVFTRTVVQVVAFVSGHMVPWLVAYASVAVHGWLTLGHVGAVVAGTLVTPGRVAALVGVELVGILAFYALWRVAGAERLGDVQV